MLQRAFAVRVIVAATGILLLAKIINTKTLKFASLAKASKDLKPCPSPVKASEELAKRSQTEAIEVGAQYALRPTVSQPQPQGAVRYP